MSAIDSAIALIESERRALNERLQTLDTALAGLRLLGDETPKAVPPTPPAPAKRRDTLRTTRPPEPRRDPDPEQPPRRTRRSFTEEEKAAAVELCNQVGFYKVSKELNISATVLRSWVNASSQPASTPAPIRILPRHANKKLVCSCGETFDDMDGWRSHNGKLKPSEFRDHKLRVGA